MGMVQGNEDLLAYDEELDALPRKMLLKRCVHARAPQLAKLRDTEYMTKFHYSLNICALRPDTKFSGKGDEQGFLVWVYYEPAREAPLIKALRTIGVNLDDAEAEDVDPESTLMFEQQMMYSQEMIMHVNLFEYDV